MLEQFQRSHAHFHLFPWSRVLVLAGRRITSALEFLCVFVFVRSEILSLSPCAPWKHFHGYVMLTARLRFESNSENNVGHIVQELCSFERGIMCHPSLRLVRSTTSEQRSQAVAGYPWECRTSEIAHQRDPLAYFPDARPCCFHAVAASAAKPPVYISMPAMESGSL